MVCKGKSTKMDDLGDRTTDALRQNVFLSAQVLNAKCSNHPRSHGRYEIFYPLVFFHSY